MAKGGALGRLNVILGVDSAEFTSGFTRAEYTAEKFSKTAASNLNKIEGATRKSAEAVNSLKNNLTSLGQVTAGAFSARAVINYADAWTGLQNRLRLVTNSQDELASATNSVFSISQATSQSIDSTAQIYQRFAQNADTLGISMREVAELTDVVSKAVAVSGATAGAAEAALTQFGQSLASGQFRGEEFNSVMEQTPALAKAIADGLGVTIGQLRAMSKEGELTTDKLVTALKNAASGVEEQFQTRVKTVAQSFTELNNAVTKYVGEASTSAGASRVLAEGLGIAATNLDAIVTAALVYSGLKVGKLFLASAAGVLQNNAALVANVVATRTAAAAQVDYARAQLAAAQATVAAASGMARLAAVETALIPAQNALTAATQRYAVAAGAASATGFLSRSLSLIGGPIGAVTLALTAGVTAWQLWGSTSVQESEDAEKTVAKSTHSIIQNIDKQIEKLKRRNEVMEGAGPKGSGAFSETNVSQLKFLGGQYNAAVTGTGQFAGVDSSTREILAKQYLGELTALSGKLKELEKLQQDVNAEGQAALKNEWLKKYGTDAQKLQMELDKAKQAFGGIVPKDIEAGIRKSFENKTSKKEKLDEGEKEIAQLQRQFALMGAVKEEEKLLAEVAVGAIKFRNAAEQEVALQIARNIDSRNAEIEATKQSQAELDDLINKIMEREKRLSQLTGRTKIEQDASDIALLNEAWDQGAIGFDEYVKGMRSLRDTTKVTTDDMTQFAIQAARNIQTELGDGLYNAITGNFDNIGADFAKMLARMAAQAAASQILNFAFGAMAGQGGTIGKIGTALLGAGKAVGGPTMAGGIYPVTERGPELYTSGGQTYLMAGDKGGFVTPISPAAPAGMQQASSPTIQTTVILQSDGRAQSRTEGDQDARGRLLGKMIEETVRTVIQRETRQGGILWNQRVGYS